MHPILFKIGGLPIYAHGFFLCLGLLIGLLTLIMEAESLFNDGVAVVLFGMPVSMAGLSALYGAAFGLMPIGGLVVPGISDLIGMRTALAVAAVFYAALAVTVLSLAGRHVCDRPIAPVRESEMAPVA